MIIINISGLQGSGKSTLAKQLVNYMGQKYGADSVGCIKYADPLYKCHDAIVEILRDYGVQMNDKEGELLQKIGDWGREIKGETTWIDIAVNRVEAYLHNGAKCVIIDDCRYLNELNIFPEAHKIRLEAPEEVRKARAESWRPNTKHSSENDLNNHLDKFDIVVETDKNTTAEVFQKVVERFGL